MTTQDEINRERYYKRVKERYFWVKTGEVFVTIGAVLLVLLLVSPFSMSYVLGNTGLFFVVTGSVFALLFGRLGWSESIFLDFLFNRVNIFLVIFSQILDTIHIWLGHPMETRRYAFFIFIIGIALAIFGIMCHSPTVDDPRLDK